MYKKRKLYINSLTNILYFYSINAVPAVNAGR